MKMRCAIGLLLVGGLTTLTQVNAQAPSSAGAQGAQAPQSLSNPGGTLPVSGPGIMQPVAPIAPFGPVPPANPVSPVPPVTPFGQVPSTVPHGPAAPVPPVGPVSPVAPLEPIPPAEPIPPMAPGTNPYPTQPYAALPSSPAQIPGLMAGNGLQPGPYAPPGCAAPQSCDPPRTPIQMPTPPNGCVMFYIGADYLYWFMKRDNFPPLLTEGNVGQAAFNGGTATPGTLNLPGTVLVAPQLSGDTGHSGARLNAGAWFDTEQNVGVQGSFFFLFESGPKSTYKGTGGVGTPLIARPYYDVSAGAETAVTVLSPAGVGGAMTISNPSNLMGGDVNVVYNFSSSSLVGSRWGLLMGARFMGLDEKLIFDEVTLSPTQAFASTASHENFTTYNRFYGGQLGLQSEQLLGPVYLQVLAKCGIGNTNSSVEIGGTGNTLLVQPSNTGNYTRDKISLVPEGQVNLGYAFNENFMFKVGYNVIVWTNVVRPGSTIDRNITEVNVATQTTPPQFNFHSSTFWAQGFQLGLQWTF